MNVEMKSYPKRKGKESLFQNGVPAYSRGLRTSFSLIPDVWAGGVKSSLFFKVR